MNAEITLQNMLQRSRARESAEGPTARANPRATTCRFNGAALVRARRVSREQIAEFHAAKLQRSRARESAEGVPEVHSVSR